MEFVGVVNKIEVGAISVSINPVNGHVIVSGAEIIDCVIPIVRNGDAMELRALRHNNGEPAFAVSVRSEKGNGIVSVGMRTMANETFLSQKENAAPLVRARVVETENPAQLADRYAVDCIAVYPDGVKGFAQLRFPFGSLRDAPQF